jgi:hypothetical protein
LKESTFFEEIPGLFEYCNMHTSTPIILGDVNCWFDDPTQSRCAKMLSILEDFGFSQSVTETTQKKGHILDWVIFRPGDDALQSTAAIYDPASFQRFSSYICCDI